MASCISHLNLRNGWQCLVVQEGDYRALAVRAYAMHWGVTKVKTLVRVGVSLLAKHEHIYLSDARGCRLRPPMICSPSVSILSLPVPCYSFHFVQFLSSPMLFLPFTLFHSVSVLFNPSPKPMTSRIILMWREATLTNNHRGRGFVHCAGGTQPTDTYREPSSFPSSLPASSQQPAASSQQPAASQPASQQASQGASRIRPNL